MTTSIIIILLVIIALIICAVVLFKILNKRSINRASLTAVIDIYPSGKSSVEFVPYLDIDEEKLIKIALLYATKIFYVIQDEPDEIKDFYTQILRRQIIPENLEELLQDDFSVKAWEDKYFDDDFTQRLSNLLSEIQEQNYIPAATKTGERFTVRLVEGTSTDYVHNDLPFPSGLAVNVPLSVMLLIDSVTIRLSENNLNLFKSALFSLVSLMFNMEPALFELNKLTLWSLHKAKRDLGLQV